MNLNANPRMMPHTTEAKGYIPPLLPPLAAIGEDRRSNSVGSFYLGHRATVTVGKRIPSDGELSVGRQIERREWNMV